MHTIEFRSLRLPFYHLDSVWNEAILRIFVLQSRARWISGSGSTKTIGQIWLRLELVERIAKIHLKKEVIPPMCSFNFKSIELAIVDQWMLNGREQSTVFHDWNCNTIPLWISQLHTALIAKKSISLSETIFQNFFFFVSWSSFAIRDVLHHQLKAKDTRIEVD